MDIDIQTYGIKKRIVTVHQHEIEEIVAQHLRDHKDIDWDHNNTKVEFIDDEDEYLLVFTQEFKFKPTEPKEEKA